MTSSQPHGDWIDGKQIAADLRAELKAKVADMQQQHNVVPGLAVILVGARRDSLTYVNMKKKACAAAGLHSVGYDYDDTVSENELLSVIDRLNADVSIHGILVQLPLPSHLNEKIILERIDPAKDVDGLHPTNVAALQLWHGAALEAPFAIPCTPLGCLVLLDKTGIELSGLHCVVLGRSHLVGLPMARLLLSRNATVTIAHSKTRNIDTVCQTADVLVAAVGKPGLVQASWLKPGAVVIDVGINSVDVDPDTNNGKPYQLVGDVDAKAIAVASHMTPVPGGVGPMTIAMLLNNTYWSAVRALQQ